MGKFLDFQVEGACSPFTGLEDVAGLEEREFGARLTLGPATTETAASFERD